MPAYNEGNAIKGVLSEWINVYDDMFKDDYRIIVINDGSKDNTADIIESIGNKHIELITQQNAGHGHALYNGYIHALKENPEWVFQTDSDGQTDPNEFRLLWEHRNDYNVIMGYRKHRQDGFFRWFSTRVLRMIFSILFHKYVVDSNTPFRLMRTDTLRTALDCIGGAHDFTNILLTGVFTYTGVPIKFIETSFKPRETGVNSVNMKNMSAKGMDAIKEMLALRKKLRNTK